MTHELGQRDVAKDVFIAGTVHQHHGVPNREQADQRSAKPAEPSARPTATRAESPQAPYLRSLALVVRGLPAGPSATLYGNAPGVSGRWGFTLKFLGERLQELAARRREQERGTGVGAEPRRRLRDSVNAFS